MSHLIVDINVPEQAVPGVGDVLAGPPQMPHPSPESLHIAETPGTKLKGDVPLVSHRGELRGHHCVAHLLRWVLGSVPQCGQLDIKFLVIFQNSR